MHVLWFLIGHSSGGLAPYMISIDIAPTTKTVIASGINHQELVAAAKHAGINLKQTFAKEGRLLRFKAGRYAHAKQFKRMGRARLWRKRLREETRQVT